jgi:predicted DNA-binding mobile mystery protein A
MKKAERAEQARRALDPRFVSGTLDDIRERPRSGWIKAVRAALGMSQEALAARLRISQPAVQKLESAEQRSALTIGKLSEVAAALDCTLVYALVPNTTLEDTVVKQAERVVTRELGYVDTTMALEDQSVANEQLAGSFRRQVAAAISRGDIWKP